MWKGNHHYERLRATYLLEGLGLGGSAVLVGTANVGHVVAPQAAVARIDIAGENAT